MGITDTAVDSTSATLSKPVPQSIYEKQVWCQAGTRVRHVILVVPIPWFELYLKSWINTVCLTDIFRMRQYFYYRLKSRK